MKNKRHRNIVFSIFCIMLLCGLSGCGGNRATLAPVVNGWQQPANQRGYYVVQKGDTLYSIAWGFNLDFRTLARYNNLPAPYSLSVGQKIRTTPPVRRYRRKKWRKRVVRKQTRPRKHAKILNRRVRRWRWPARGKVISGFSRVLGRNKGINIRGRYGEPIYAAASGRVVYRGSSLRGYGRLIIIKHNANYLSAYAHNKVILVREGQKVRAGQRIALMGKTRAGRAMLHFEIRRNGKPVNPLWYLPRR